MKLIVTPLINFTSKSNQTDLQNDGVLYNNRVYRLISDKALNQLILKDKRTETIRQYKDNILIAVLGFNDYTFRKKYLNWIFSQFSNSIAGHKRIWNDESSILLQWAKSFNQIHQNLKIISIRPQINNTDFCARLRMIGCYKIANHLNFDFRMALQHEYQEKNFDKALYKFEVVEGFYLVKMIQKAFDLYIPGANFQFHDDPISSDMVPKLRFHKHKKHRIIRHHLVPVQKHNQNSKSADKVPVAISSTSSSSKSLAQKPQTIEKTSMVSIKNRLKKIASLQSQNSLELSKASSAVDIHHRLASVKSSSRSASYVTSSSSSDSTEKVSYSSYKAPKSSITSINPNLISKASTRPIVYESPQSISSVKLGRKLQSSKDREHSHGHGYVNSSKESELMSGLELPQLSRFFKNKNLVLSKLIDGNKRKLHHLSSHPIKGLAIRGLRNNFAFKPNQSINFMSSGLSLLNSHVQRLAIALRDNINVISHLSTQYTDNVQKKVNHHKSK